MMRPSAVICGVTSSRNTAFLNCTVAGEFVEFVEDERHVVQRVGPLRVARELRDLPRREPGEDLLGLLHQLVLELADLVLDVEGRAMAGVPQFLDLAFQFGDRLLEIEEVRVHSRFALRPSPAATRQCSPRGAVVKSASAGRFRYGGGFGCMRRLSRAERAPTGPLL